MGGRDEGIEPKGRSSGTVQPAPGSPGICSVWRGVLLFGRCPSSSPAGAAGDLGEGLEVATKFLCRPREKFFQR